MMTELEFEALASEGYNRIALVSECMSDLETPLSVYLKLAARDKDTFLLESAEGGKSFSRYSFIGLKARTKIVSRLTNDGFLSQVITDDVEVERDATTNPIDFVQSYVKRFRVASPKGLPRLTGGFVGYFGYDTVRLIEAGKLGQKKSGGIDVPDICLLLCEELVVIDNFKGRLYFVINADPSVSGAYTAARQRIRALKESLSRPVEAPYRAGGIVHETFRPFEKAQYLKAVARAQDYIFAGDCMQVQIGQRFERIFTESPISLYRSLRSLNPAPYMYYYNFGDYFIVGASPEILVRSENRDGKQIAVIRPIAGTRPRGGDPSRDKELAQELLNDPKERAEHLMLIDLARNDIGRIAKPGTVRVTESYAIERYSQVQHLVSHVEGELKDGMDNIDVLKAAFPAGTLTGAPKVRAMEIIDELEPVARGIYGGAVGYLSFAGDMDLAIAIRTALIKDKRLYVQAAAGIVADSIAENEYHETEIKAGAILRAAELTETGLEVGQ